MAEEQQQQPPRVEAEVLTIRVIRKPGGGFRSSNSVVMLDLEPREMAAALRVALESVEFVTQRFFGNLLASGDRAGLGDAISAYRAMARDPDKTNMREAWASTPPQSEGGKDGA